MATPVGGLSLLAVLVYVADEYPTAYAGVMAQALARVGETIG
jgi:hypothetical protein